MNADLDTLHLVLRYSHIVAGFLGLALFWIPVFAAKGGRLHLRAGRAFVWCATFVGLTGLGTSAWALIDVDSFLGRTLESIPERSRPYVLEQARFLFAILGYLSLLVLSGLWFAVRAVRTKQSHEALREPILFVFQSAVIAASLALVTFGAINLLAGYRGEHLLPKAATGKYWVPVVLGVLGLLGVQGDLGYVLRPRPTRMAWWYKHMENMIGVGIAFHTAFLVFGANRLIGFQLPGAWALLPWVVPSAIGIPATHLWVRYYKKQFGEWDAQPPKRAQERPEEAPVG